MEKQLEKQSRRLQSFMSGFFNRPSAPSTGNALERFRVHLQQHDCDGHQLGEPPLHEGGSTLAQCGRQSPPRADDLEDSLVKDTQADRDRKRVEGTLPTYRSVKIQALLAQAEASKEILGHICSYMDERWKLEARYQRERARLRLPRRGGAHPDDRLDKALQLTAIFQEVTTEQVGLLVEDVDKEIRSPLPRLRDELARTVSESHKELGRLQEETEGWEKRIAKQKVAIGKLKDRRGELLERLERYRTFEPPNTPSSVSTSSSYSMAVPGGAGGQRARAQERRVPEYLDGDSLTHAIVSDSRPSFDGPEWAEYNGVPSAERRLQETESEIMSAMYALDTQTTLLLRAMKTLDRSVVKWSTRLEELDRERREVLLRTISRFVHAQRNQVMLNVEHLALLVSAFAEVETDRDMQAFIRAHAREGCTPLRSEALRLIAFREQRERLLPGGTFERDFGKWRGGKDRDSPRLVSRGPGSPYKENSDEGKTEGDWVPGIRELSSEKEIDYLGGEWYEVEQEVRDQYVDREDGPVVRAFLWQVFGEAGSRGEDWGGGWSIDELLENTAPVGNERAAGTPRSHQPDGLRRWDHGRQAGSNSCQAHSTALHWTQEERDRFFERIFGDEAGRGRAAFLHELNQQRSKETEVDDTGFELVSDIMWELLVHCQRRHDIDRAKMAMMLAQTFYRLRHANKLNHDRLHPMVGATETNIRQRDAETNAGSLPLDHAGARESEQVAAPSSGSLSAQPPELDESSRRHARERAEREYLSSKLLGHPLWVDYTFWREALEHCVTDQLPTIDLHSDAWHDLDSRAKDELVHRIHSIIFSQLATLAHSMLEYGNPEDQALDFVLGRAGKYQLPEDMRIQLLKHLFGILEARRDRDRKARAESQGESGGEKLPISESVK